MIFNFDKIELFNGMVSFSYEFIIVDIILMIIFIMDWYISYKETGIHIDYWRFFCITTIFIPIIIYYPFAASYINYIAVGDDIKYIVDYVDDAYFISVLGYLSMLIGKLFLSNFYSGKLNLFEKVIYNNYFSQNVYYMFNIFAVISLLLTIFISYSYSSYILNLREIRFDSPMLGALINGIIAFLTNGLIFYGLYYISTKKKFSAVAFAFLGCIAILIGTRAPLFNAFVIIGLILIGKYHEIVKFWHIFMGVIVMLVLVIFASLFRSNTNLEYIIFLGNLLYGNSFSDLRDFAWVLTGFNDNLVLGKTYISGLLSFIPSGLFEFRNIYGLGIVTNNFAGIYAEHFGLRAGIFGEMYLNFGFIGVIIGGMILGGFLQYTNNTFIYNIKSQRDYTYIYTKLITFMGVSTLLTQSSSFSAFYIFILINFIGAIVRKIRL